MRPVYAGQSVGAGLEAPLPAAPGLLDAQGMVIVDHDCKRCGYNLRGLHRDWRCPECGTPVGLSLMGDFLCYSSPEWVERVARGLTIILWMIPIGIVLGIIARVLTQGNEALTSGLQWLISLVSFYGAWLMTTPDPSGIGEDPNLTARKLVRVTLVVAMAGNLLALVVAGLDLGLELAVVLGIAASLAGLVGLVGEFAKFIYYEKLASRVPNWQLASRARFLRWAFTITLGVVVVCGAAAALGIALSEAAILAPFACLAVPGVIALIVFSIMTLILLIRLRREVAAQARVARRTWAAHPQAGVGPGLSG
ncbi:MAG: hypothetical protein AB1716_14490 [Planctomycetota bacterium]